MGKRTANATFVDGSMQSHVLKVDEDIHGTRRLNNKVGETGMETPLQGRRVLPGLGGLTPDGSPRKAAAGKKGRS